MKTCWEPRRSHTQLKRRNSGIDRLDSKKSPKFFPPLCGFRAGRGLDHSASFKPWLETKQWLPEDSLRMGKSEREPKAPSFPTSQVGVRFDEEQTASVGLNFEKFRLERCDFRVAVSDKVDLLKSSLGGAEAATFFDEAQNFIAAADAPLESVVHLQIVVADHVPR